MTSRILENRRVLRQTFGFIEAAHNGVNRSRTNSNGEPRSYDHHPMEVALLYAEMEVFHRRNNTKRLTSELVADKIVEIVEHMAKMDKRELKTRLCAISRYIDDEQMTVVVGLLCHDTIESAYDKHMPDRKKIAIIQKRTAEIRDLRPGAEVIALLMTDSRKHKNKKQKRSHQLSLARNPEYAALKKYDNIVNMSDQVLIPNEQRKPKKKRALLKHMRSFMRIAHRHNNIPFSFLIATHRVYERSVAQLG